MTKWATKWAIKDNGRFRFFSTIPCYKVLSNPYHFVFFSFFRDITPAYLYYCFKGHSTTLILMRWLVDSNKKAWSLQYLLGRPFSLCFRCCISYKSFYFPGDSLRLGAKYSLNICFTKCSWTGLIRYFIHLLVVSPRKLKLSWSNYPLSTFL